MKEESLSSGGNNGAGGKFSYASPEAPGMFIPNLAHSVSVREAIHEVKMVQVKYIDYCMSKYENFFFIYIITSHLYHRFTSAEIPCRLFFIFVSSLMQP